MILIIAHKFRKLKVKWGKQNTLILCYVHNFIPRKQFTDLIVAKHNKHMDWITILTLINSLNNCIIYLLRLAVSIFNRCKQSRISF